MPCNCRASSCPECMGGYRPTAQPFEAAYRSALERIKQLEDAGALLLHRFTVLSATLDGERKAWAHARQQYEHDLAALRPTPLNLGPGRYGTCESPPQDDDDSAGLPPLSLTVEQAREALEQKIIAIGAGIYPAANADPNIDALIAAVRHDAAKEPLP